MRWFEFFFPLGMILSPAIFSVFIRIQPAPGEKAQEQTARIQALRMRLWLWTAGAVILFLALYSYGLAELSRLAWILFFPLWFHCTMPLLQAKDHGWRPALGDETSRSASLVRRDIQAHIPTWAWLLAGAIWLLALVGTIGLFVTQPHGRQFAWVIVFPFMGGAWLLWGRYWASKSALEPEPIDAGDPPELSRAYADFRRAKMWAWYAMSVMVMLVMTLPAVMMALRGTEWLEAAIWVGAGGGSLAGILGGVVGVWADLRRAKLSRLYQRISANPST
jgi:roadblock/LC7 domain-containing protein